MSTTEITPSETFARSSSVLVPKLAEMAIQYQTWHAQNAAAIADMVSGLAAANAVAVKTYVDRQLEIILDPAGTLEGLDSEMAAVIINTATDGFLKGSDILRRHAQDAIKAAEMSARLQGAGSGQRKKKPGFSKKAAQPLDA